MKNLLLAWLGLAGAALPLGAQPNPVDAALPAYQPAGQVSGNLIALSADDEVDMLGPLIAAFKKYQPRARITARSDESRHPRNRTALGPHTDEIFHYSNQLYEDTYGYEPFRIQISMGAYNVKEHVQAIALFVNPANPATHVSLAELDAMYSSTRRRGYPVEITTWGQIGLTGEWAVKPIHIYGRGMKKDEVGMFFRDVVMFYGLYKDSFQAPGKGLSPEVVNAVAHDPDGIGFVSFWYGQRLGLKALAIVDANGAVVEPTQENVASGRYPLVRPMYMYINRRPGEPLAPLVKEFLTFVLSREGQELINRTTSYLPLPAAIAAAERAKLE